MYAPVPATFPFTPAVKKGERVRGGMVFGSVQPVDGKTQRCLVPPNLEGEVVDIVAAGDYAEDQALCTLRAPDGSAHEVAMSHLWPVRTPRPISGGMLFRVKLLTMATRVATDWLATKPAL